jgi:PEGA domain
MNSAHDLVADPSGRPTASQAPVASWYTQGASDGLGDRLLMFDNTGAASLELLRFKPQFASAPGFEQELRDSVRRFASFRHPAFSQARSVQCLEGEDGLALISTHTRGKRLSEIFHRSERHGGMHPAFASWLIRELAPALADLHAQGPAVAHGALTADRIVLTPDRRLVIVEHVLGAALDEQCLSPDRLWQDLGVIAAPTFDLAPRLDSRFDIVQLGLIILSVLLGRRVTPDDYPSRLTALLDEFVGKSGHRSPTLVAPLRQWLEHALDLDDGFGSALEAMQALPELPEPAAQASIEPPHAVESLQLPPVVALTAVPETSMNDVALTPSGETNESLGPRFWADAPAARRFSIVRNAAVALGVAAIVEAAVIGRMLTTAAPAASVAAVPLTIESPSAGDAVLVDGREVGVTPFQLSVGAGVHSVRVVARKLVASATGPAAAAGAGDARAANALALAAQRQRSGGLRLSSPIELQVLEGEHVLGSSADGLIVAPAGEHQLDFINAAVGYRSRQMVNIKAGQIIPMTVQPPDGKVSINAQPWAQVWIDGNLVGETPLANLSVPVGEHEIVFRHPQFGERREKTIIKSGVQTRISTSLNK